MFALWTLGHEPPGPLETCRPASYNPPPKSARKSQQIGETNWRTDFSTKQLPTDLDRGSRPQTHLPFGCCPVLWGWATDHSCGGQLCCVRGPQCERGGGPVCTMNCDSTRHIQKSRHPTPDHARIGTALSSNTEWGYTHLHTTRAALLPGGREGGVGVGGLDPGGGGGGLTREGVPP